ncbi:DUF5067 domain-containing protein [Dellaglioa sp. L3N]
MKKTLLITSLLLSTLLFTACGSSTPNDKKASSSQSSSSKVEKASSRKTNPKDASNDKWSFKNNTFSAGILTYKFTKTEVSDSGLDDKSKVIVLHTDITNNSDKEQDPSNIFMVLHAYQKTDTANKNLNPGSAPYDSEMNVPLQKENDALTDKLLPGKTTKAIIVFTLENTSDVTLKFSNSDFQTIGKKIYSVK